jgi:hypothetical protein
VEKACDYYLFPAMTPLVTYFAAPLGATIAITNFDFERFQRRTAAGNKQIVLRRIAVLDAIYSYPEADVQILLHTPEPLRAARVAAGDEEWRTRVADRWAHLELSKAYLDTLPDRYDAILSGADPVAKNVAAVGALIEQRVTRH